MREKGQANSMSFLGKGGIDVDALPLSSKESFQLCEDSFLEKRIFGCSFTYRTNVRSKGNMPLDVGRDMIPFRGKKRATFPMTF